MTDRNGKQAKHLSQAAHTPACSPFHVQPVQPLVTAAVASGHPCSQTLAQGRRQVKQSGVESMGGYGGEGCPVPSRRVGSGDTI